MLNPRQELILRLIIEDYIKTAEPVGSKYLAETYQLGVSPATVRNEMAFLEQEGFIRQPHTSAGRIPSETGYQYFLTNILKRGQSRLTGAPLRSAVDQSQEIEETLKHLAKRMTEVSGETAIVATDPKWSYYAGVSNLFHKPDFHTLEIMRSISSLVDQFDDIMHQLYDEVPEKPQVFIGTQNPFGREMATILVRYELPDERHGILGLVGPLRMDYGKNIALVERAKNVITELYE